MDKNYHLVSVVSNNYRGRKKQPGNLIYDPESQKLGVFLCYCGECNAKILTDTATISKISKNYNRSKRTFVVRVLLGAAKRLE